MAERERTYVAIDLKSFYASVECVERSLDPLNANLVVADESRTNKTICLAVSPSLKSFGIPGRPRLFEVEQKVKQINRERQRKAPAGILKGKSVFLDELQKDPSLALDYIVAVPRMGKYVEFSNDIYGVYLKYVSAEDIHVYSIDEVFIDVTAYLNTYRTTARELALRMIRDVMSLTGVTATAGIGSNLYLAKVAMDIVAKHLPADKDGVRIAEVDEMSYRKLLWTHEPLTDFWRVGPGIMRRLEKYGIHTMGDIARFSLRSEGTLYDEFGINAELLIDHAWGYEPCTMKDIKAYKPENHSTGIGQVLMEPYSYEKALVVMKEMVDNLALDLTEKRLCTNHVSLYVGYDSSNDLRNYQGEIRNDWYGRRGAGPGGGSAQLHDYTSSSRVLTGVFSELFKQSVNSELLIRRININADHVVLRTDAEASEKREQFSLFSDPDDTLEERKREEEEEKKEESLQHAILDIKRRFGKNSVLKGTNFEEGATGRQRNEQIGGHRE